MWARVTLWVVEGFRQLRPFDSTQGRPTALFFISFDRFRRGGIDYLVFSIGIGPKAGTAISFSSVILQ